MPLSIRLATPDDAAALLAIYEPIVRRTATSFELEPPTVSVMAQRIADYLTHAPWLVCERDSAVVGYAYASKHRERAAYQWTVEVSAYVHPAAQRQGIGRALYTSLCSLLRLQGFFNACAVITLPNFQSVTFHESLGFQPIGVMRHVGYKLGRWHDVGWWQLLLQPAVQAPSPLQPLAALIGTPPWHAALEAGVPPG